MELAAMAPDAAALGVPIPGKHESPQRSRPSTGVFRLGKGKGSRLESLPEKGAEVPGDQDQMAADEYSWESRHQGHLGMSS